MITSLFKLVTTGIRVRIITITIYVIFREPNGTLVLIINIQIFDVTRTKHVCTKNL
jgi:hypothetical protein